MPGPVLKIFQIGLFILFQLEAKQCNADFQQEIAFFQIGLAENEVIDVFTDADNLQEWIGERGVEDVFPPAGKYR